MFQPTDAKFDDVWPTFCRDISDEFHCTVFRPTRYTLLASDAECREEFFSTSTARGLGGISAEQSRRRRRRRRRGRVKR